MRNTIADSWALEKTERLIAEHSTRSIESLAALEITDQGRNALAKLADQVINRAK
jgi:geranylgeranyl diphosphate synthase type I